RVRARAQRQRSGGGEPGYRAGGEAGIGVLGRSHSQTPLHLVSAAQPPRSSPLTPLAGRGVRGRGGEVGRSSSAAVTAACRTGRSRLSSALRPAAGARG